MNTCKTCNFFVPFTKESSLIKDGVGIGTCDKEPFDTWSMESNNMAIICGHDGPIYVGEDFGCVNYERKESW